MKNSADQGGCYPQRPKAEVDNNLRDLQNSSYPTQPHSIIAIPSCVTIQIKVYIEQYILMVLFIVQYKKRILTHNW